MRKAVTTRPQVIHFVKAEFPHELDKVEVTASVAVAMVVDTAGHPTALHIVKAAEDQEFNAEALRAVGQYRFKPAQRDHQAVPAPFRVTIEFSNQDVDDRQ